MSTLTIQMPESLARERRECAAKEGVTVEHLRQRALRANREDFAAFLDASPDVPPLPGDEL